MQLNPLFAGMPQFNKKPNRLVFIPQKDYPDVNFIGLSIGPRGMFCFRDI